MTALLERLGRVPPFTLGFVQLCLLQAGVDRVDPTAGEVERLADLLLLAFAVAGLVVALSREPEPTRPGGALAGLLLRGGVLLAAALLLLLLLTGARLNPLADVVFVVSLLVLALITLPHAYDPSSRPDVFLARWAVPAGAAAVLVAVPVVVVKLVDLA